MTISMRGKLLAAAASLALLGACDTTGTNTGGVGGSGGGVPAVANAPAVGSAGVGSANAGNVGGVRPGSQEDLAQRVGDRIFFDSDRSDLRTDARRTVEGWAGWLRQNPTVAATIEGHADERGTREYNLALGERRAAAARNFLISQGIEARRLSTVSFGKERPTVLGSTEQAWAQNRRAVMLVN
ncbi:MAG: peptidoglycan-associated lipoprotein Pal [Magnetospirillum sp.]|jgi:peptidoglycan-associated lipoprotein|nr:peptidoglycan-associated lipoprotein Pal [Magnetospirillum sp.]